MQYSSSDSATKLSLQPSVTIRRTNDIDADHQARHQWQKIFNKTNIENSNKALEITQKICSQIKLKTFYSDNLPLGDNIHENHGGVTILFHNINGIKDIDNWHQIMTTMKELQIDIFGFVELNKTINHGKKFKWIETMKKYYYYSRNVHSESNIDMESYKPGGTMTTVTRKWQSRITELGQDKRGLGRWSYIKISTNKKSIIIMTAYRPCVTQGPSISWMQQWALLGQEGISNPDPIKIFYQDLEEILTGWRKDKNEIILMDANEPVGKSPGGLTLVVGKVGMSDILRLKHQNIENLQT
jgi:hypothetical protein